MQKVMNKAELAAFLGVSSRTLSSWQAEGLPILVRGRPNRYDLHAVAAWLERTGRGLASYNEQVSNRVAAALESIE